MEFQMDKSPKGVRYAMNIKEFNALLKSIDEARAIRVGSTSQVG